ncbi:MAG: response regulator transcription factor [Deltaproteobacteria bacterium]|nr:response regulator transcription factor [Deltaproteobacteria bacterium]
MISIVVVDDHELVRSGICRLLDGESDITILGQTGSGHEAVALCRTEKPDVVLLDYNLPDLDGLETTQQIVALGGETTVLILTMYANEEYATRLIQAGASGFIVKAASADEMLLAIRKVAARGIYVSPEIMDKMVVRIGMPEGETPEAVLSNREMQVLVRLARGATTREVSGSLNLSQSTVETYRSRILEKLNLRNNSDITRFAIRRGLIDLD